VENERSSIATVQGMVDRILLAGAFGARHPLSLATPNLDGTSPGPFSASASNPLRLRVSYTDGLFHRIFVILAEV
jgi:hypothetical protein